MITSCSRSVIYLSLFPNDGGLSYNFHLQQLLNDPKTDKESADSDKSSCLNNELLQKLLQDEDEKREPESSDGADQNKGIVASSSSSSLDLDFALGLVSNQTMVSC